MGQSDCGASKYGYNALAETRSRAMRWLKGARESRFDALKQTLLAHEIQENVGILQISDSTVQVGCMYMHMYVYMYECERININVDMSLYM